MNRETLLQHLGEEFHHEGAVTPPIFQTSLFVQDDVELLRRKSLDPTFEPSRYVYSRVGNPTLSLVEKKLAMLEKTDAALAFNSGMAAIAAALLHCVQCGDHVVAVDTAYGPTRHFLTEYLPKFGVETTYVPGEDVAELEAAIRPNTKAIYLESPGSILYRVQDLRAICAIAHSRGIRTLADNSYCTPIFQNPADLGVDIVIHSATKYLAGHSDLIAGVVCASQEICDAIAQREGQWLGARLAPFDAWLLLRGMRTLHLRVEEARRQGQRLFEYLKSRPEVAKIYYAGDPDHPHRKLIDSQQSGSTGLVTFEPQSQDADRVREFCQTLSLFQLGVSWGGYESLVVPVFGKPMDWDQEKWVIRLYPGLEHFDDLAADLDAKMPLLA